ncbi:HNH nuclease [Alkalihalobacillus alcalophilus ATCC 27647 = CGMCC 1.3604]|uniref:HNH nuclease n=1 Tax=Alkalihalobacillus alcalophilus ATCC 27647 = CGMCC 1.3604 TaxID=1218173 RepID=A0A094XAN3_ALKAL|nr:HNH endonuclease [Alkalihalobacillus alcalophilus]KGA95830.1 HNH nuclease [Alkalihalobacillus alcalophilus ATCC 27647 = CGMCC 1.3604]
MKKTKKLIIGNKSDLIEIIKTIGEISLEKKDKFDRLYINFTNRVWSKALLEKINVRVCPYCNRQYTFTLANEGIRPQFDHFFPKSRFSYLSVSLYNLIPSCSICNSKKHDLNTYEHDLYYPYEDEFGSGVVFQTSPINNDFFYWTGASNSFDIKLICKDEKQKHKVENLKQYLKIELLYKKHKDYVRDIIRNAVIYNDSRIDELLEQFPDLFQSKNEVINSIFMSNNDKESWDKRPLSKLTHDIYEEFKIFSGKK